MRERRPRAAITHKFQWTIIPRLQFGGRVGARAKVGGNQGHLQVPVDHHLGLQLELELELVLE